MRVLPIKNKISILIYIYKRQTYRKLDRFYISDIDNKNNVIFFKHNSNKTNLFKKKLTP